MWLQWRALECEGMFVGVVWDSLPVCALSDPAVAFGVCCVVCVFPIVISFICFFFFSSLVNIIYFKICILILGT